MTSSVISTIEIVAFIVITIWQFYCINKKNLAREERYKQFFQPIASVFFVILAMVLVGVIKKGVISFFRALPEWMKSLESKSWMNESVGKALDGAAKYFDGIAQSIQTSFLLFAILNIIILFIYTQYKRAWRRTILKLDLKIEESEMKGSSGFSDDVLEIYKRIRSWARDKFYYHYKERKVWILKEEYGHTRTYVMIFFVSIIVLSLALLLPMNYFVNKGIMVERYMIAYPFILIGEVFYFINGLLKEEYNAKIAAEEDSAETIHQYHMMRKFLRDFFIDKIISDDTVVDYGIIDSVSNQDLFEQLRISEDPKEVAFGKYYEKINEQGFELNHHYLYASLKLMHGKSVLFNNPFYNDFSPYVFYPMNRSLLEDKKVLVILGRHGIEKDIKQWIIDGLSDVTDIPSMWKVGILGDEKTDCNIGILSRSNVNDFKVQKANSKFFKKVDYCIIIEPSRLLSTMQIGLNSIIKRCKGYKDKSVTFCTFDKNTDGLVDTLSHILMEDISEVSSTDKHDGVMSYVSWNVDSENIQHRMFNDVARYLGMGTELSFVALKNQISKTEWFGGDAFPVNDMNWIDKQYYRQLLNYADLPSNQEVMDQVFQTTDNFWSAKKENIKYMTVEDESFNMFEIVRNFATRSKEEGFINVISTEYLFKDYMGINKNMFEVDSKAIPYIVPDYARTGRNLALKLILMLSTGLVSESIIRKELTVFGLPTVDSFTVKEQLWNEMYNCFASAKDINLEKDYESLVEEVKNKEIHVGQYSICIDVIGEKKEYNPEIDAYEKLYFIEDERIVNHFIKELKSASYITEEEIDDRDYLGSELLGNIFQKILPGQYFTYNGKYYEMEGLTGDNDVLVRRAADHISGRPTYRQIRKYTVDYMKQCKGIGTSKDYGVFSVRRMTSDINVDTDAYFKMSVHNDFKTAKKVTVNNIPRRIYRNKNILEIQFPDGITEKIKYTLAVLLNESFRSFFAENQEYIIATTDYNMEENGENPLTYQIVGGDDCKINPNSIYIIEDNQMDIGLLTAVERNLKRIFETILDYLNWHKEFEEFSKTIKDMVEDSEKESIIPDKKPEPPKKDNALKRLFRRIFGKKKKEGETEDKNTENDNSKEKEESLEDGTSQNDLGEEEKDHTREEELKKDDE